MMPRLPGSQKAEKKVRPGGDVLCLIARRGVVLLEVVPRLVGFGMVAKKVSAIEAALQVTAKYVVSERASWNQKGA